MQHREDVEAVNVGYLQLSERLISGFVDIASVPPYAYFLDGASPSLL